MCFFLLLIFCRCFSLIDCTYIFKVNLCCLSSLDNRVGAHIVGVKPVQLLVYLLSCKISITRCWSTANLAVCWLLAVFCYKFSKGKTWVPLWGQQEESLPLWQQRWPSQRWFVDLLQRTIGISFQSVWLPSIDSFDSIARRRWSCPGTPHPASNLDRNQTLVFSGLAYRFKISITLTADLWIHNILASNQIVLWSEDALANLSSPNGCIAWKGSAGKLVSSK